MNAADRGDGVLVGIAAAAAFAAGLIAVAQHADCTSAGYRLAVAERENVELRRGADQVERRVDALRTPQSAMARAAAMKLTSLKYPKTWNVVRASTVERAAAAAAAPTPVFDPTPIPTSASAVPLIPVSAKGTAR